jgi:SAM-dependent methyltransferase
VTQRRLDLGAGAQAKPGFVSIDRFLLPGVEAVADLDAPHLPFEDDSFDLVYAFHSLEHAADLMGAMREVWRVGRPGAQVCITAPYYTMSLNLANPYHKQAFNEHTPRFWTASATSPIDRAEWQQPPLGAMWGLSRSDNSDPGFDLRCLRMEFFYFEEYWGLSDRERRAARRRYMDVCEQILYHLVVFKPPMTDADVEAIAIDFYMPPQLEERRLAAARRQRSLQSPDA